MNELCDWELRPRVTNLKNSFRFPFVRAMLLLVLLAACGPGTPTAGPEASAPPLPASTATPLPTLTSVPPSPAPTTAASDLLLDALQALAAYEPVADAQPVVELLLSGIAGWLDGGGEPSKDGNWMRPCPVRDHYGALREWVNNYQAEPEDEAARLALDDAAFFESMVAHGAENAGPSQEVWETEYLLDQRRH